MENLFMMLENWVHAAVLWLKHASITSFLYG